MRDVLVSLQIGIEDQALTHRVSSGLGHVDGGLNRAAELEFVDLNWYNLHQWKLLNKLLGTLVVEAVLLNVPPGAFKVDTLHVGSVLESLSDVVGVELLSYNGVKSWFIQGPAFASASRLHESCQVGLRNMETWEPDDFRLFNLVPLLVLLVAA